MLGPSMEPSHSRRLRAAPARSWPTSDPALVAPLLWATLSKSRPVREVPHQPDHERGEVGTTTRNVSTAPNRLRLEAFTELGHAAVLLSSGVTSSGRFHLSRSSDSWLRVRFTSFRKLQTSLPPAFASAAIVDPTFRMAATPHAQCSSNRNVPRAPSQLREDLLCRLLQHVLC